MRNQVGWNPDPDTENLANLKRCTHMHTLRERGRHAKCEGPSVIGEPVRKRQPQAEPGKAPDVATQHVARPVGANGDSRGAGKEENREAEYPAPGAAHPAENGGRDDGECCHRST